jgi:hypothetical protein
LAVLAGVCLAMVFATLVWTLYDSFDHSGPNMRTAIIAPVV